MRLGGEHKTKLNYETKLHGEYYYEISIKQFVNFPGKQGLAIKSKERIEHFDIISCQLPTIKL